MTYRRPRWWPREAIDCFDDLVSYRLVGASACADRITAAVLAVAVESEGRGRELATDVADAAAVFCGLKPDTALYRNLTRVLERAAVSGDAHAVRRVHDHMTSYRNAAQEEVVAVAVRTLGTAETLLVHDYSSMVARILGELAADRPREIVVTAGEPLGQGPRVARLTAAAGHRVTYTPDTSVGRVIDNVDAFVTGVESFYADGSLVNTVGSLALALLCRHCGVPVIAPAELLKCDPDLPTVTRHPSARMLTPWPAVPVPEASSVVDFVLDAVPGELVSFYATERGLRTPAEVGAESKFALAAMMGLPARAMQRLHPGQVARPAYLCCSP